MTGQMIVTSGDVGDSLAGAADPLRWIDVTLEEIVGNRLGAGVYRRWVDGLGLEGHERVLEVGTGAGACARHLAAAVPEGSLTCLELDARWLEIARRRLSRFGSRVEFVQADASRWMPPAAFDVVVTHFVLHDMAAPTRAQTLARIAEALAPGGCLCVREPVGHGMAREELRAQLDSAGFVLVGDERLDDVPLMGPTMSGVWLPW